MPNKKDKARVITRYTSICGRDMHELTNYTIAKALTDYFYYFYPLYYEILDLTNF